MRARQFEDDLYPDDRDWPDEDWDQYPDPDLQRDLAMENPFLPEKEMLDDPMPFGWGGKTGGYEDPYLKEIQ